MKEEKPYIEILEGQLVGAEQTLEECREIAANANANLQGAVHYYRECMERYKIHLEYINQNTKNGNN